MISFNKLGIQRNFLNLIKNMYKRNDAKAETPVQYFGHLMGRVDSLEKTDAGRDWGQEEKGTTEDEMAGWHH